MTPGAGESILSKGVAPGRSSMLHWSSHTHDEYGSSTRFIVSYTKFERGHENGIKGRGWKVDLEESRE